MKHQDSSVQRQIESESHNVRDQLSMRKVLLLIFLPTSILTIVYLLVGHVMGDTLPTILIFLLLAMIILFPIQLFVVVQSSKKEYGSYSLKSAFSNHQKLKWWKVLLYASFLWGFAGLMSVTIAPLEVMLFAPISEQMFNILPPYFDWVNIDYGQNYSRNILLLTCVIIFILNVFIGPIVEELFFRGYLTSKMSRFKNYTPLIVTVLFSLYHLWLPFNNLFRIIAFFPAFYLAWKKKNIYIAIVVHCLCNAVSTIGFIAILLG
ncbi:CPBP family intramembrane metalloprotease [Anaerobacillus sp. CMMVII]|uniref:CPBP family intramembrane glutamic endopeptidase n=1 Tax=Anaerobacillus sp. CMMVII TaxID=2755588 RepID=UPI0021B7C2DD|nr:type II CAAX endopeptidase family protein [Anaerobacillus sp. CMMVII]MCT8139126.1 CPBP family intramembrane metalloprotease [Anaerobacillus sp. CMMVII]